MDHEIKKEYHQDDLGAVKVDYYEPKEEHFVSYYAVIPAKILNDNDISDKAKILYGHITAMTNQKGYCWATNNYLSKIMKCSLSTIKRTLKELKNKKHLVSKVIKRNEKIIIERRLYLRSELPLDQIRSYPKVNNELTPMARYEPENTLNINNTINKDIDDIYKLYPTRCYVSLRSTNKGSKDKQKIKKLLKTHTKQQLINKIESYLINSKSSNSYIKNFASFLNNLPDDIQEEEVSPVASDIPLWEG